MTDTEAVTALDGTVQLQLPHACDSSAGKEHVQRSEIRASRCWMSASAVCMRYAVNRKIVRFRKEFLKVVEENFRFLCLVEKGDQSIGLL